MKYTNPAFPTQNKDGLTDRQLIGTIVMGSVIPLKITPEEAERYAVNVAETTLIYVDAFLKLEKETRK